MMALETVNSKTGLRRGYRGNWRRRYERRGSHVRVQEICKTVMQRSRMRRVFEMPLNGVGLRRGSSSLKLVTGFCAAFSFGMIRSTFFHVLIVLIVRVTWKFMEILINLKICGNFD